MSEKQGKEEPSNNNDGKIPHLVVEDIHNDEKKEATQSSLHIKEKTSFEHQDAPESEKKSNLSNQENEKIIQGDIGKQDEDDEDLLPEDLEGDQDEVDQHEREMIQMHQQKEQNDKKSNKYFGESTSHQHNDMQQHDIKNSPITQYYSVHKERKQAEQNTQSLKNRISLLKQEEVRTLKKIEETRKKAMEIYYLKLKNQKKSEAKQVQQQSELAKKKEKVSNLRTHSQESKRTNKEMYETMKLDNAKRVKELKLNNERKIQEKKQSEVFKARERNEFVKQQRETRQQKLADFQNWKKDNIKREIEEKALSEDKAKLQKIREMKRMEVQEMDIIQRLQSTQMMQKHAYEELESALLLKTEEFYDKYLKKEQTPTDTPNEDQKQGGEFKEKDDLGDISPRSSKNSQMQRSTSQPHIESGQMMPSKDDKQSHLTQQSLDENINVSQKIRSK